MEMLLVFSRELVVANITFCREGCTRYPVPAECLATIHYQALVLVLIPDSQETGWIMKADNLLTYYFVDYSQQ